MDKYDKLVEELVDLIRIVSNKGCSEEIFSKKQTVAALLEQLIEDF